MCTLEAGYDSSMKMLHITSTTTYFLEHRQGKEFNYTVNVISGSGIGNDVTIISM